MNITDKDSSQLFICSECGLHYTSKETAEACADWCKKYKSCNIEITSQSIERKAKT